MNIQSPITPLRRGHYTAVVDPGGINYRLLSLGIVLRKRNGVAFQQQRCFMSYCLVLSVSQASHYRQFVLNLAMRYDNFKIDVCVSRMTLKCNTAYLQINE